MSVTGPWCCEDEDGLGIPEVFAAGGDGRRPRAVTQPAGVGCV